MTSSTSETFVSPIEIVVYWLWRSIAAVSITLLSYLFFPFDTGLSSLIYPSASVLVYLRWNFPFMKFAFVADLEFRIVLLLSLLLSNVFLNVLLLLKPFVIVIVIFGELTFGDLLRLLVRKVEDYAPVDGRAKGFALV